MNRKIILFVVIVLLVLTACNTVEPPPGEKPTLTLKLEDVSCTEAWIKLTTNNIQLPAKINLIKNDNVDQTISLSNADTLLYVDSLLPNQTYRFQAISQSANQLIKSNEITVVTMDTTSHNFTFQSWTFGTIGSSTLYDVAIIDENNIWAVGGINIADTSINGYTTYNAVHWDGTEWELKRIKTNACGGVDYPTIKAIFAFAADDILFAHIDGSISYYDGIDFTNDCSLITQLNGSANKIWGVSNNNYYVVSSNGFIAHWDGRKWRKVESGTTVDLRDVCGLIGSDEIFVSGYSTDLSKSILIRLKNNTSETIWENYNISGTPPYGNLIYSISGCINNLFVASNQGVYKNNFLINYPSQKIFTVPRRLYKVLATNINDIYTAGDRSNIWHFNGISKKELFANLSVPSPLYSAAIKENIFVAVGTTIENVIYHQATIIILKKI